MKLSELPGVGPVTEKKFNDVGIFTAEQIINYSPADVADITGMKSISVRSLFVMIRDELIKAGTITETFRKGNDVLQDREDLEYIKIGISSLDKLFVNGIETKATTEIYGEFGSGKTQFCHTMAVRVQLPKDKGGLAGKVLWIDSENTFRPDRIITIAKSMGLDPKKTLDNIIHSKAFNSTFQQIILEESETIIEKENIRLIISDSATGLFRSDYIGRGNLSNRQGALNKYVTRLSRISETYNCAVIMTNQVYKTPDLPFGDPTRPVGGDIVAHSSTYRIYFKKSGKNRIAKMIDSPNHAETEVMFALSDSGVVDVETRDDEIKAVKKAVKVAEKKEIVNVSEKVTKGL